MAGTRIKATCPVCGEVEMRAEDVVLSVSDSEMGSYTFVCPNCDDIVEKRADARIIKLLMAVNDVQLEDATGDWNDAFLNELWCDDYHRWNFPVQMGQRCLCGDQTWDNDGDQMPPRPDQGTMI